MKGSPSKPATAAAPAPVTVAAAPRPPRAVEPVLLNGGLGVVPELYDLTITPSLDSPFIYAGELTIELTVALDSLKEITLHARDVCITKAVLEGAAQHVPARLMYDKEENTVTLGKFSNLPTSTSPIPTGKYRLKLDFTGEHNNQMAGFYRSSYKNANGVSKLMVSTFFAPLDARRCFPCIDEPAAKAVFRATLIIDENLTALSNMPEESSTVIDADGGKKKKKVVFKPSPKMSTYLLAFAVGEFDFVEAKTKRGVLVRVYTPPAQAKLGNYALTIGVKSLEFYDDMFGQPYPLPKMDMIAIPEFAMGAMENWGLVTYREVDLLIDFDRASSQQRQRVCGIVAHELAHQWFGNLVTMEWWDDLWLNEGFASWMQDYTTTFINPDWDMWTQFVNGSQASALRLDALITSHPIQVPIGRAEEVEQVFDTISYCKGACVVRIVYAFLGDEMFKKGLRQYMARHAYKNTRTLDLWQAWEEVSGKPVLDVMKSWTEQMGFPLLSVSADGIRYDSKEKGFRFVLDQEWFLADGSKPPGHAERSWKIPLFVSFGKTVASGTTNTYIREVGIMDKKTHFEVFVPVPPLFAATASATSGWWCKLNGGQNLPLRVLYKNPGDLDRCIEAIRSKQMGSEDRCGMLNDMYALAKAGTVDPGLLLTLLSAFSNEDSMEVLESMEGVINGIGALLQQVEEDQQATAGGARSDGLYAAFRVFVRQLIAKPAAAAGWDSAKNDGHLGKLRRAILIRLQCTFMNDDPAVIKQAQERFDRYIADPESPAVSTILPAEFKTAVFRLVLSSSNVKSGEAAKRKDQMLQLLAKLTNVAEKKTIYNSIGSVPTKELKVAVLDWACKEVLMQDFFYPFYSVNADGIQGATVTWEYFVKNFDTLYAMVANASFSILIGLVAACCSGFASEARAAEIEAFFAAHPVPQAARKVAQILESTRTNAAFATRLSTSPQLRKTLGIKA